MRGLIVALVLTTGYTLHAHHGGGTFDSSRAVTLTGKLTKIDFINPHSWIYFEVTGPDGKAKKFRCETRSAHTLRRSGWKPEMFKVGQTITIEGSPDRNDPQSCLALTRSYVAEDPVYLKGKYTGSDFVQPADAPYAQDHCSELGLLDYSKQKEMGSGVI